MSLNYLRIFVKYILKNNDFVSPFSRGYSDVTNNILNTLKSIENGCQRCIFMHSWYSEPSSRRHCPFFLRWSLLLYIGPILDNMRKAEKILEDTDDVNYTVILPAGLGKGPVTGN